MDQYQKIFFVCGALFGFLGVLAGAFGSHFLKQRLNPESLQIFEIAVRYQMYHALALVGLAAVIGIFNSTLMPISGWFFVVGTIIFSGSLYILVFTGNKLWGAVTPVGGVFLLLGWLLAVLGAVF